MVDLTQDQWNQLSKDAEQVEQIFTDDDDEELERRIARDLDSL